VDSYLDRQRIRSKAKSVRNAECSCGHLLRVLGNPSVYSLIESDLDHFVLARRKEGVRDKTINGDLIILRAVLNHAVSVGLMPEMPFKVRLLKVAKKRQRKVFSREELRHLLDCASKVSDKRIYGILLIAMHSGFRADEILHLRWSDSDPAELSLRITSKADVGWSSKSHQERTVFVAPEVFEWLARWRSETEWSEETDWIFSTRSRRPMSATNVSRAVRRVFEDAGLYESQNAMLHLIRHTVATRLLTGGVDLETTRDVLGHADVSTTALYLHSSDQRKKAAAGKLAI
jgi:integrase